MITGQLKDLEKYEELTDAFIIANYIMGRKENNNIGQDKLITF